METVSMIAANLLWATGVISAIGVWIWQREVARAQEEKKRDKERRQIMNDVKREVKEGTTF